MRIITPGQLPEEQIFKGTCHYCKCVFECKRAEGEYHQASSQRDDNYLSVKCPTCGRTANAYKKLDQPSSVSPDFYENFDPR